MKSCLYCGREQTDQSQLCPQCGNEFEDPPPTIDSDRRNKGEKQMRWGLFLIAVSLGMAWLTSALDTEGRHPLATFVLLIYGLAAFFRGRASVSRPPNSREKVAQLLNSAAFLEGVDRTMAIAAYQRIVEEFPNTPESEEALRNIQTLVNFMQRN